jgi:hypothetical protein
MRNCFYTFAPDMEAVHDLEKPLGAQFAFLIFGSRRRC